MGTLTAHMNLHGVESSPLRQFEAPEGSLLHMLRSDSPQFLGFGEVYISTLKPGAIKAWKLHHKMTQNLVVPHGQVQFVIYDGRKSSPTYGSVQEIVLSRQHYTLLKIPPGLWYGFRGLDKGESLIVNCASIPHDPAEIERLPHDTERIPYIWNER